MAYTPSMRRTLVEMPVYTKRVLELLDDDQHAELQAAVAADPKIGDVMPGSGGIRKLRWKIEGRGKRGGVRVIYYWANPRNEVLMLYIYPKSKQEDLTPDQTKRLRQVVREDYQ